MTMGRSLAWVGVPALRDSVSGPRMEPFDAASWMRSGGTLYVISSGEVATSTALFRAVVEKLHRDCVYAGTFTWYHRVPNPVLFALDEVTQTAQVPLDQSLATSAGSGIQVCYVVHTPAQLRARYGTALADAIWALTGTKIVLGGNSDEEMGTEISRLCGQVPAGESMRPVVPEAYKSVLSCVAHGFKARLSFRFTGCCWWRSLPVDGSSGASRGHARNA